MEYLIEHADKIGTFSILIGLIIGWWTGKLYSGRSYDNLMEEKNALRKIVDDANTRDRERLERVELQLADALRPRR